MRAQTALIALITVSALALLTVGCGPAHRHYQAGGASLTSDRLSGGWSLVRADLPERHDCVKWQSQAAAGLSCLPAGSLPSAKTATVRSTHLRGADASGWTVAQIGRVLCLKWEAHHDEGDLSCFVRVAADSGQAATIDSHKAGNGWSLALVRVPGQQPRLCAKWAFHVSGKNHHGGGAVSCLPTAAGTRIGTISKREAKLAGGWSLESLRSPTDSFPAVACLKWQGHAAAGMDCFPLERDLTSAAISSTKFGSSGWSTQTAHLPGYPAIRCLKWSDHKAGGVSCWPRGAAA